MQKGNVNLVLVVIVVLLVGFGAYYLGKNTNSSPAPQPSPTTELQSDETANWKTYTNKYGYSLKYPPNFILKDMTAGSADNFLDVQYLSDQPINGFEDYKVKLIVDEQSFTDTRRHLNGGDTIFSAESDITTDYLGDKEIVKAISTSYQTNPNTGLRQVDKRSYLILIPLNQYTLNISADLENKDLVDKIFSTFKFIP